MNFQAIWFCSSINKLAVNLLRQTTAASIAQYDLSCVDSQAVGRDSLGIRSYCQLPTGYVCRQVTVARSDSGDLVARFINFDVPDVNPYNKRLGWRTHHYHLCSEIKVLAQAIPEEGIAWLHRICNELLNSHLRLPDFFPAKSDQ